MWDVIRAVTDDLEHKDIQRGDSEKGTYDCREWPRVCGALHAIIANRGLETLLVIVARTTFDNLGRDLVRSAEYEVSVLKTELSPRWCEVAFVSLNVDDEMSIEWIAWKDVGRRHFERSIQQRQWRSEPDHVLFPSVMDELLEDGSSVTQASSSTHVSLGHRPTVEEINGVREIQRNPASLDLLFGY